MLKTKKGKQKAFEKEIPEDGRNGRAALRR